MGTRLGAGAWGAINGQTCLVHSFHLKSPISPKIQVTVWEQPEQKCSLAPGPAQLWAVLCPPPGPPGLGWHYLSPEKSWTAESLGRVRSSGFWSSHCCCFMSNPGGPSVTFMRLCGVLVCSQSTGTQRVSVLTTVLQDRCSHTFFFSVR